MSEQFILSYLPQRLKELEFRNYHLRYRDLSIEAEESITIEAYNDLFFIVDEPPGVIVQSDYGVYDSVSVVLTENVHQHRGEILITNPGEIDKRIKFIQVIIVN